MCGLGISWFFDLTAPTAEMSPYFQTICIGLCFLKANKAAHSVDERWNFTKLIDCRHKGTWICFIYSLKEHLTSSEVLIVKISPKASTT